MGRPTRRNGCEKDEREVSGTTSPAPSPYQEKRETSLPERRKRSEAMEAGLGISTVSTSHHVSHLASRQALSGA